MCLLTEFDVFRSTETQWEERANTDIQLPKASKTRRVFESRSHLSGIQR